MATLDARCLDAFPNWLRTLGEDARALAAVLEKEGSDGAQRRSAAALNYLFKSLDLIPDGLEDLRTGARPALEQITNRAGQKRFEDQVRILINGQHHVIGREELSFQLAHAINAAHLRKIDVHQDHVRLVTGDLLKGCFG